MRGQEEYLPYVGPFKGRFAEPSFGEMTWCTGEETKVEARFYGQTAWNERVPGISARA